MSASIATRGLASGDDKDFITHQNQQRSLFFKLPAEIRNRVYHIAFQTMTVRVLPQQGSLAVLSNRQDLALICTCRQIRHEATSLFYQLAEFRILYFSDLCRFYRYMNKDMQFHVRSISIWVTDFDRDMFATKYNRGNREEQPFPNVKDIVIYGPSKRHPHRVQAIPKPLTIQVNGPQREITFVYGA